MFGEHDCINEYVYRARNMFEEHNCTNEVLSDITLQEEIVRNDSLGLIFCFKSWVYLFIVFFFEDEFTSCTK